MSKKIIPKNKVLLFLLIYTLLNIFYNNIYINSIFWLIFLTFFYYKEFNLPKRREIKFTLIISIIFFIIYLINGFIFVFVSSLNNSLVNNFINIIAIFLTIVGIEIIRFKLIKSYKNNFKIITIITFIIILSEINFKYLFSTYDIDIFYYITQIIVKNILYTYLSFNTHFDIPIIIRIFDEIPKLFLPTVLNGNWFIMGSFNLIKVVIIYHLFNYFIFKKKIINYYTKLNIFLYSLSIIISIILVLFMLGLFSYHPIVILSNSMSPTFKRGDIVIYKEEENIVPGDIIIFKHQSKNIVHRVKSINDYYVTKGDANKDIDYINVKKEDIKGIYKFHVKYLGYPSIWVNELFSGDE